ncbi:MAG: 1-acyl-sn-glycerol-3-phosphate acyltransferase [Candidatus Obscuribacterales bacterium]|nr:1-acyl-sn-glycerol-3-phosphate acyltransferase [Candidatus Obscuribacterales bacterium]
MRKTRFIALFRRLKQTLRSWKQRIDDYSQRCLQSGFIPFTYGPAQLIGRILARAQVFIQLGKLRVKGGKNLSLPGLYVFCPNHSSMADAPILYAILNRWESVRYMTAYEEMRGIGGLKAIFMGAMGCFAVDRSQGRTVIEPAIEVLLKGQCLTIFPEGRISETGELQPFKKGAAIIAGSALAKLPSTQKVGIVPICINYHKRDNATARKSYLKMGLKWRAGVTVTVGQPIYLNEREGQTPEQVMEEVRDFISRSQKSQNEPCKCGSS